MNTGIILQITGITLDGAIIAAVISAIISIGFLVIREFLIEPKKWKRESQKESSLKQIEAYGELLAFLDGAEARRKAWVRPISQIKENDTHVFLLPGHEIQFNKIFRENMAYFSSEVIDCYKSLLEKDKKFDLAEKKWKQDQNSWYQGFNLSEMHQLIKKKFNTLRKKHENTTGHSFT